MQQQTNQPPLESFVTDLIREAQYKALEKDVEHQIKHDILTRLNETITARVIASLSDEDVDGFNELLDTDPSEEAVQAFIGKKIPDHSTFLTQILVDFRKTYLGIS